MPRLSRTQYQQDHELLRRVWLEGQWIYGLLSPMRQRVLHDFYRPSEELTDNELVEYRKKITKKHPAVPNRAGKTLRLLHEALQAERAGANDRPGALRIYPVVKPEPDLDMVVSALLATLDEAEQEKVA